MKMYQIGEDLFNFEFLIKVRKDEDDTVTLYFVEGQTVTVTLENWQEIKSKAIGKVLEFANDVRPSWGVY